MGPQFLGRARDPFLLLMKTLAVIFLQSILLISVGAAQTATTPVAHPFTDRLLGNWTGDGMFGRSAANGKATWESVLERRFVRFSIQVDFKSADGKPRTFAGQGYYQAKAAGEYEGQWFDSEGHQYPIKSKPEGDSLVTLWGIPGQVSGRSVYRLSEADKVLEVIDSFQARDGSWKELNRYRLRRN